MSEAVTGSACYRALEQAGVPPAVALAQYMELLLDWNERINLTGAKGPEELARKHVADVWGALQALDGAAPTIVDVGSGGGLPGIALAIMLPETRVILVERTQKKARVLAHIVSKLGLDERVRVESRPFEEVRELRSPGLQYWFRGFLPGPKLAVYLSQCFPRADLGQLVLMKGPGWGEERLKILETPKVKQAWIERIASSAELTYSLPGGAGERVLVLV